MGRAVDMTKPILCLDFDGVCHLYTSGWKGATVIPDAPTPGMWSFIETAWHHFDIHIYSSRSSQPGGIAAMQSWFILHADTGFRQDIARKWLYFPQEKPPAFLTIDDRGLLFTGVWPNPVELLAFKPWNKQ